MCGCGDVTPVLDVSERVPGGAATAHAAREAAGLGVAQRPPHQGTIGSRGDLSL